MCVLLHENPGAVDPVRGDGVVGGGGGGRGREDRRRADPHRQGNERGARDRIADGEAHAHGPGAAVVPVGVGVQEDSGQVGVQQDPGPLGLDVHAEVPDGGVDVVHEQAAALWPPSSAWHEELKARGGCGTGCTSTMANSSAGSAEGGRPPPAARSPSRPSPGRGGTPAAALCRGGARVRPWRCSPGGSATLRRTSVAGSASTRTPAAHRTTNRPSVMSNAAVPRSTEPGPGAYHVPLTMVPVAAASGPPDRHRVAVGVRAGVPAQRPQQVHRGLPLEQHQRVGGAGRRLGDAVHDDGDPRPGAQARGVRHLQSGGGRCRTHWTATRGRRGTPSTGRSRARSG